MKRVSPKTELVKLNTALWLPHFAFGRQHRLDMSKCIWKTPRTNCFCIFPFLSAFTYVQCDQPRMVDLPYIPMQLTHRNIFKAKRQHIEWQYFGLYINISYRWKLKKKSGKHSSHRSVQLWHYSGTSLFWSFYAVLIHTNQSTNFCFTTLESWNFLIKRVPMQSK